MLLLLLFGTILCGSATRSSAEKSYTVEIDNFEINTGYDQKYISWDTLGLKKKSRNKFVLGGTFILNRNLANEQRINIKVFPYNRDTRMKGILIFNMEKEICKYISTDKDIYPALKAKSNLPEPDVCPIPKNEYTVEDYEFGVDFLGDEVPRGDYLVDVLLKDGKTPVAGLSLTINIGI